MAVATDACVVCPSSSTDSVRLEQQQGLPPDLLDCSHCPARACWTAETKHCGGGVWLSQPGALGGRPGEQGEQDVQDFGRHVLEDS